MVSIRLSVEKPSPKFRLIASLYLLNRSSLTPSTLNAFIENSDGDFCYNSRVSLLIGGIYVPLES
jgi:hypothetical protein